MERAVDICKAFVFSHPQAKGPIIVADYADNPGGGAYGDSTALLAAMLAAGVQDACFGGMTDPQTVQQLFDHQPGDTVSITTRLGDRTRTYKVELIESQ